MKAQRALSGTARSEDGGSAAVNSELRFRDPKLARELAATLKRLVGEIGRPVAVMHVCGSHEQAIAKFGLRSLFPKGLEVIMGPGCPVCVTDTPEVDEGVLLARQGVRIATFGDMLKVPGTVQSLADAQASGGKLEIVYSPKQAVDIARKTSDEVVFFATGFETTAVATAAVVLAGLPPNFSVLSAHKYIPPVMEIVAEMPDTRVEGFLAAGHAATITGWGIFEPFVARHGLPVVVAGFEPLDVLQSIAMLLRQLGEGRCEVENQYKRVVPWEGNRAALRAMAEVFQLRPYFEWRGLGFISQSALRIRDTYAEWDSESRFTVPGVRVTDPKAAQCGEVLKGVLKPAQCKLFGTECTPEHPLGALMVSSEGSCAAYFNYQYRKSFVAGINSAA